MPNGISYKNYIKALLLILSTSRTNAGDALRVVTHAAETALSQKNLQTRYNKAKDRSQITICHIELHREKCVHMYASARCMCST